jgi:hypothetical protein
MITTKVIPAEKQKRTNIGLQAMTPMYGQVIVSAPSWSGPFQPPPIPYTPNQVLSPNQMSSSEFFGRLATNVGATVGCAMLAPEYALGCPLLGQTASSVLGPLYRS